MDRMWALWQAVDPATRHSDLNAGEYGHITWGNNPVSNFTSLDDIINMGILGPSVKIGDVMDTLSGPLCYIYM